MTEIPVWDDSPVHGAMQCRNGGCLGNVEVLPRIALEIVMDAGVVRLAPTSVQLDTSVMECNYCGQRHQPESARMARYLREAIDDLAHKMQESFALDLRADERGGRAGDVHPH